VWFQSLQGAGKFFNLASKVPSADATPSTAILQCEIVRLVGVFAPHDSQFGGHVGRQSA
jgi:hypothetical protein